MPKPLIPSKDLCPMTESQFELEALNEYTFAGYSDGRLWNGWATPYFSFDQAVSIVEVMASYTDSYYNESTDEFVFDDGEEEQRFCGSTFNGLKLYGIGAGSWMWEEAKK